MKPTTWWVGPFAVLLVAPAAVSQVSLDMRWDPGAEDCTPESGRTQSHQIDETTVVFRQNPCVDFEAPLMYLLIGHERALLLDSGASDDPKITSDLTAMVGGYLARPDGTRLPLVVAHTHGHQDHRAGDEAFAALPATTVVPYEGEAMRRYFAFKHWPDDEVRFDLGGREVVLRPAPGHHPDHLVFLDTRTRVLFTGDFYLPGRLLVDDIAAYRDSAMRLVEFVQVWGIEMALGAHIEMNAAKELYANGASFHPDEHSMAMPLGMKQIVELHGALMDFNGFYNRHPGYAIANPVHNLIAIAVSGILAITLLVWGARRLLERRRRTTSS